MDEREKSSGGQLIGPQEGPVEQQNDGIGTDELTERRVQKTFEYLRSALAIDDPLLANEPMAVLKPNRCLKCFFKFHGIRQR